MKNFFITFKKTITDRKFYQDILKENSFKKAFIYSLKLALLFSVVMSVLMLGFIYFSGLKTKIKDMVLQSLPVDFVANIKDHKLSINKPEPYIIPLNNPSLFYKKGESYRANLAYIDTSLEINTDLHKTHDAILVASKETISVENISKNEVRIISLKGFENMEITQAGILSLADRLFAVSWVLAIIALIPFMMMNLSSILIAGIFAGLLVMILSMILKQKITFKQSMVLSLYGYSVFGFFMSFLFLVPVDLFWPKIIATSVLVIYFISNKNNKNVDSVSLPEEGNTTQI